MLQSLVDLWPVIGSALGAAAVYGGIRADLKAMRDSIGRAHERIDAHADWHIQRGK